jgi:Carboxypeptidase regulatory-like domain
VTRGKHRIAVVYRSPDPFFFTTASDLEVDESATVNFGIGHTLSSLIGQVMNDAGQGLGGITVLVRSRGSKWSTSTEAEGSFLLSSLIAGDYDVRLDEDSLPVGYSTEALAEAHQVTVGSASPGNAVFTVRAFRSISGQVSSYDSKAGQYIPVAHAQVVLRELGLNAVADETGRYLFRDLAPGTYSISVPNDAQTSTHMLRLGVEPAALTNVDFQIRTPGPPSSAPIVPPVRH